MTIPIRLLEQAIEIIERNQPPDSQASIWLTAARAFLAPPDAARQQAIEAAREQYGSDDLEIDDDAQLSGSEDGTWVWLPAPSCDYCGQLLSECHCDFDA